MNKDYLLGVGNLRQLEILGPYGHAHNTIMELIIQAGLIGTVIIYFLTYRSIKQYYKLISTNNKISYHLLFSIILFFIFLSPTESLFMEAYFSHLLFISALVIFEVVYYTNSKSEMTNKFIIAYFQSNNIENFEHSI